ncbi:MAG: SDR family oxidoreductase [Clostridia bacterium]|nr:SDR family oxidoreductase [Clostridia bacterium]
MKTAVVLVTGGSSGIGKETALALSRAGCTVYEGSRRDSSIKGITHITLDVTDEASAQAAARTVAEKEGGIDILINCAGFGISGAVEFTRLEDARRQMDINFFGTVNMTKAVLPYMRKAGKGRIVNISSVAAAFPIPFQTYYSASKAAINAYTLALSNEVKAFGITAVAVQPGDIKTEFTASRAKSAEGDAEYGGRISRSVSKMEKDEENGMSAQKAGCMIAGIALKKKSGPVCTLGLSYKVLCLAGRLLPLSLANKIIGSMYAG